MQVMNAYDYDAFSRDTDDINDQCRLIVSYQLVRGSYVFQTYMEFIRAEFFG